MLIQVAVGIVFNADRQVLIAERPAGKLQSGFWEFPGGKVEANETVFCALQRELLEEIGIQVVAADAWLQLDHGYADREVRLHTWRVTEFLSEPVGKENQRIQWVSLDCLDQFEFLPGNKKILELLLSTASPLVGEADARSAVG